jgi:HSP20 family molecular chaperone IbpA
MRAAGYSFAGRGGSGAMTRVSPFNSPLLLGFDEFERTLDRISKKAADGYPPYNIEQIGEDRLCIVLAVAGFGEDLAIEVVDNQLVIRGKQREPDAGRVFLHRGIAARQFQRAFILANGIQVDGARLHNGLLHIDISRPKPESRVRRVAITTGKRGNIKESARKLDLDSP